MDLSIYLARVFGIYLVVACVAILINKKHLPRLLKDFSDNLGLIVFSGFVHLFLGLLVVVAHNIWVADFRGLITVIGWLGVIKGGLRLLVPTKISRMGEEFGGGKKLVVWGIVCFAMGLYLLYFGFIA